MLNQRFASFNEGEKKVLFEGLLLNEEFKEYLYQKISKEEIGRAMNRIDGNLKVSRTEGFGENTSSQRNQYVDYDNSREEKKFAGDDDATGDVGNYDLDQENAV